MVVSSTNSKRDEKVLEYGTFLKLLYGIDPDTNRIAYNTSKISQLLEKYLPHLLYNSISDDDFRNIDRILRNQYKINGLNGLLNMMKNSINRKLEKILRMYPELQSQFLYHLYYNNNSFLKYLRKVDEVLVKYCVYGGLLGIKEKIWEHVKRIEIVQELFERNEYEKLERLYILLTAHVVSHNGATGVKLVGKKEGAKEEILEISSRELGIKKDLFYKEPEEVIHKLL